MGLIKAALAAAGGTLADQYKEYFYCEAMDKDVLVTKGFKRSSKGGNNGNDNIITSGSLIAVADGQCMLIVEQGKVVEASAEPGEFVFDSSTEPTIFEGKLGASIIETFQTIGKRFTFGGETAKDQRVYYINTKELLDNKFGTPNPIMFRVVDSKIGFDMDVSLRCSGTYSYRIANPLLFYTNVCGNVSSEYRREEIESQLKAELLGALQPALGKLSDKELRPNQIISHNTELEAALNETLSAKWGELRGLQIVNVSLSSVTLPEDESKMLQDAQKEAQKINILRDPGNAAASIANAQSEALRMAASNTAGAVNGFMGMGMVGQQGVNTAELYKMAAAQQAAAPAAQAPAGDTWTCECGATATGKFCAECGKPKPVDETWTCACGAVNKGKFCSECGKPKPVDETWTCACGAVNKGKFCSECGKPQP